MTTSRLLNVAAIAACVVFTSHIATADDMPTLKLLINGGRFTPEILEVPAGTRFRLTITNAGPGASEFESLELKKEKVLAPGVTSNLIFYPLRPGTYNFFDDFNPETGKGKIISR